MCIFTPASDLKPFPQMLHLEVSSPCFGSPTVPPQAQHLLQWTQDQVQGFASFFRKASLRLAFLLRVDGLAFFLVLPGLSEARLLSFASREKEIVEPILREKLKAKPWSANVWQRSRHLPRWNHLCQQLVIQLCLLAVWLWSASK